MSLRKRAGNWHYRFYAAGKTWTGDTGLVATEHKRNAALLKEAEARKLVSSRHGDQLHIQPIAFGDAAGQFLEWAKGKHHAKPQTWKRLRGSMASLKMFFKAKPLHGITVGDVQDYMSWRLLGDSKAQIAPVKEVSLRHDLHALSPLFKYGMAHNWCRDNPVTSQNLQKHGSKIPSDADAVRIHVLSTSEEKRYFEGCLNPAQKVIVKSKPHVQTRNGKPVKVAGYQYEKLSAREYRDLHDIARIMILQGPRPSEVMQARVENIDLEKGVWLIPKSKSAAGKRVLRLTAEARSIFASRISEVKSGWVFPGRKAGTHLVDVENAHLSVLRSTGLAFVLYDCRHTFATRFYEATRDVEALRKVLGHSNLRTIQKYVHVSEDHVNAAMQQYEVSLAKNISQESHHQSSEIVQ